MAIFPALQKLTYMAAKHRGIRFPCATKQSLKLRMKFKHDGKQLQCKTLSEAQLTQKLIP